MNQDIRTLIQNMPKAELHVHLEGSTQPATVLELARRHNKLNSLPANDEAGIMKWFTFTDFPHFLEVYLTIQDLIRTPEDFELITYRFGEDMARQNIRYREATVTPYIHINEQDKGLTIEGLLDGLEAGRQSARRDFGVEIRWVFDISRQSSFVHSDGVYDPEPADTTLSYALMGKDRGVVALGLGGYEVGTPARYFAHAFENVQQNGLLSVPHAGETAGAESVWGAVKDLGADRIGHGVRAVEDPDLLALLKDKQIPLEVNLSSNICLHVFPDLASHSFVLMDQMELMLTLGSDDPPLFSTDLVREYGILADIYRYGAVDILRIARNGFLAAGVDSDTKSSLLQEFDAFASQYIDID